MATREPMATTAGPGDPASGTATALSVAAANGGQGGRTPVRPQPPLEKSVAGMLARYVYDLVKPWRIDARRKTRQSMVMPRLLPHTRVGGSVWAVSVVRNEVDIIDRVVRHMLDQGVDGVLVADNGSRDGTLAALRALERAERRVHVALDPREGHYQAARIGQLSRAAQRAGADWIVPFDADEFWFAPGTTLAAWLRACRCPVVGAELHNVFPQRDDVPSDVGGFPTRLDLTPARMTKVAFRAHRLAHTCHGNHAVSRSGKTSLGLYIAHVPWRTPQQFTRKVREGASAVIRTRASKSQSYHWKALSQLSDDRLRASWEDLLDGRPIKRSCWTPVGPFRTVDVLAWETWDAKGSLPRQAASALSGAA